MNIDRQCRLYFKKIFQHFVRKLRREYMQKRNGAYRAAHSETPSVREIERGRGNKVLCGKSRFVNQIPREI